MNNASLAMEGERSASRMVLDLTIQEDSFDFTSAISSALEEADREIQALDETIASVKELKPECDKMDYILAASSGLCVASLIFFWLGSPMNRLWVTLQRNGFRQEP